MTMWDKVTNRLRKNRPWRVSKGSANHEDRKEATKHTQKGRYEYNVGLYDMAARHFEAALEVDPRYQRALYFLGNAYYKQHKVKDAVVKWEACIEVNAQAAIASKARRRIQHVRKGNQRVEQQLRELEEDVFS